MSTPPLPSPGRISRPCDTPQTDHRFLLHDIHMGIVQGGEHADLHKSTMPRRRVGVGATGTINPRRTCFPGLDLYLHVSCAIYPNGRLTFRIRTTIDAITRTVLVT